MMKFKIFLSINRIFFQTEFLSAMILTIISRTTCVNGVLLVKPVNAEVVVGQSVRLHCSTSETTMEVYWQHTPLRSSSATYVYYDRKLVNGYPSKFLVDTGNETGRHDLILLSAEKQDAGVYRCMDRLGSGESVEAQLVILDSHPVCEVRNLSFCDKTTQTFDVFCSLNFSGNIRPEIGCTLPDESIHRLNESSFQEKSYKVAYSLQAQAQWPIDNGQAISCRTKMSGISSTIVLSASYAFSSYTTVLQPYTELIQCNANSSERCGYTWIDIETRETVGPEQQTLETKTPGRYLCIAECQLESQTCTVNSMVAEISAEESTATTSTIKTIVVISVIVIILITVVVIIIICIKRMKSKCFQNEPLKPESTPLSSPAPKSHSSMQENV